jgi:'Cold-shock' DNA-binding domain
MRCRVQSKCYSRIVSDNGGVVQDDRENELREIEAWRQAVRESILRSGRKRRRRVTTTVRRGAQPTREATKVNNNGNMHGEIIFFLDDKGYGFVSRDDGGQDLFFHRSRLCDPDLIPKKRPS